MRKPRLFLGVDTLRNEVVFKTSRPDGFTVGSSDIINSKRISPDYLYRIDLAKKEYKSEAYNINRSFANLKQSLVTRKGFGHPFRHWISDRSSWKPVSFLGVWDISLIGFNYVYMYKHVLLVRTFAHGLRSLQFRRTSFLLAKKG